MIGWTGAGSDGVLLGKFEAAPDSPTPLHSQKPAEREEQMADINVERKGTSIWPWIIGLIVLALLIWLLAGLFDNDDEIEPIAEAPIAAPVTPAPIAQGPACVGEVIGNPVGYVGQRLGECQVQVVDVPTDRAFWIEENGQRVLVILNEGPGAGVADTQGQSEMTPDINPGQSIRLREATVMDNIANVAGPLDDETRNLAQGQPFFLTVDAANVVM